MKTLICILFLYLIDISSAGDSFRDLTTSIYCPSCQGQVLDESNSSLAIQMKKDILNMLDDGKSPEFIRTHFSQLYGEKVLLNPLLQPHTYLLWLAPFLICGALIMILLKRMRFHRPGK
jgi:cytochrome c-type biogenesis protein CcmH